VISQTTKKFWKAFENLPRHIQDQAREVYTLWKSKPDHPALQFKIIHKQKQVYSVRIGIGWRALGVRKDNTMIWFWIGSHAEYDRLISKL
jgi:hypothetical protein